MISFKCKQFKKDIILMTVRWYVAYLLSYRNIEELMVERGVNVDHSTINRLVIEYSPKLENEFRKKYKSQTNSCWKVDETYLKIKGKWCYLYRAVDKYGATMDFMLSEKRDIIAAKRFFIKAINSNELPEKITIDKSGAKSAGLKAINLHLALLFRLCGIFYQLEIRQIKYLNNIVESDHRSIKRIVKPMMNFKAFHSAEAIILGIELQQLMLLGECCNAAI